MKPGNDQNLLITGKRLHVVEQPGWKERATEKMRLLLLLLLLLLLCFSVTLAQAGDDISTDRLVYRVLTQGEQAPQFNRILVNRHHVRLDDGSGRDGFLLYDRKEKVIYSVNPEDRTTLEIAPKPVKLEPVEGLKTEVKKKVHEKAPMIGGSRPVHVELLANGQSCEKRIVVAGPMKRALEGLREYHRTLSYQQRASLGAIPADMQNDCDLALHVYHSDLLLQEGMAIQRWGQGQHEELVDFAEGESMSRKLFELPKEFRRRAM